jgi:hypothetical protein
MLLVGSRRLPGNGHVVQLRWACGHFREQLFGSFRILQDIQMIAQLRTESDEKVGHDASV